MTRPEKCPSNNPMDIDFYVRGFNDGQEELRAAVQTWITRHPELFDGGREWISQSLLSAMEHA